MQSWLAVMMVGAPHADFAGGVFEFPGVEAASRRHLGCFLAFVRAAF
jgi:hypothetical protein